MTSNNDLRETLESRQRFIQNHRKTDFGEILTYYIFDYLPENYRFIWP